MLPCSLSISLYPQKNYYTAKYYIQSYIIARSWMKVQLAATANQRYDQTTLRSEISRCS